MDKQGEIAPDRPNTAQKQADPLYSGTVLSYQRLDSIPSRMVVSWLPIGIVNNYDGSTRYGFCALEKNDAERFDVVFCTIL